MKKIRPTPISITHKKPIYMSASDNNEIKPTRMRYNPAEYNKTNILEDSKKYLTTKTNKISRNK